MLSPQCLADRTEAVHMNMWGLQLHFITGDLSVQGCLSFQYRHKSSGDRAVSFFFFSASKANYTVTTSQVAVFNFAFCGVCVVTLVRQWERNSNTDVKEAKQNTSAFVLEAGRQRVHNAFEEKITGKQILKKTTPWLTILIYAGKRQIQKMAPLVIQNQCNPWCHQNLS